MSDEEPHRTPSDRVLRTSREVHLYILGPLYKKRSYGVEVKSFILGYGRPVDIGNLFRRTGSVYEKFKYT